MRRGVSDLGPLPDGGRVVIIGGGPGGAATAIALRLGARAAGKTLHVVLVEGKQFAGKQHHNQCAGVLSPPVGELLERQLQVPFPHSLSRNVITGYVLHTPHSGTGYAFPIYSAAPHTTGPLKLAKA